MTERENMEPADAHPHWKPATLAMVMKGTGMTEAQAREAINGLVAKGLSVLVGPDEWQISVAGVELAKYEIAQDN